MRALSKVQGPPPTPAKLVELRLCPMRPQSGLALPPGPAGSALLTHCSSFVSVCLCLSVSLSLSLSPDSPPELHVA